MMKIIVLKNYGGSRTKEQRILPGEYDSEAKELFGLADYLVENGHAVVVEGLTDKVINVVQGVTPAVKQAIVDILVRHPVEALEDEPEDVSEEVDEEMLIDIAAFDALQETEEEILEDVQENVLEDKPKRKRGKS